MPFGPTGTHGRVSVLGCLQTAGLQPGGFLPPAAGLVFKGLISKSHICASALNSGTVSTLCIMGILTFLSKPSTFCSVSPQNSAMISPGLLMALFSQQC